MSIYKWKNTHTYHLKILGEYEMCLSQSVLFLKEILQVKNVFLCNIKRLFLKKQLFLFSMH